MNENEEEMDPQEVMALLGNPAMLKMLGYQITPKGAASLFFMREVGLSQSDADFLAQKLLDAIFLAGYIYVHESEIDFKDPTNG